MATMHEDWKAAKKRFEILTGKHKPAKSFLIFFHESTKIDKYLKACDTLSAGDKIDQAKLKAAMAKLKVASDDYLGKLKAEKALETGGSKDVVTVVSKGISSLRQSLKKYEAEFQKILQGAEVASSNANPKQKIIDAMLVPYKSTVKAAIAGAKTASARLSMVAQKLAKDESKLDAAVAIYNKEINDEQAARKLTTALGAYANIEKMGGDVSGLVDPKAYIKSLDDFSAREVIGTDIGVKGLIKKIKDFDTAVKAISAAYK